MSLYPYQQKAVDEIRKHYQNGTKKVLLHLATGGGKTHIFSYIMQKTANNGKRCIMAVRGRELVKQASKRLDHENVDHGVLMANHWRNRPLCPIQICSIDTLYSRKIVPPADLVVIDEAHMATSEGYLWLSEQLPNAHFLAVTATPYCDKSLRHVADVVVHPITIKELIEQKFLVPCRHYAPSKPNLKGVRTVAKDYDNEELEKRMDVLTGNIVEHWIEHAEGRPTLCFAVNVHHSKSLRDSFISAGIPAEHVDANTSDEDRELVYNRMRSGETKIICNVGILGVGFDMPAASCIIMARPTKSYNLYIQQAGRGTRTFPGKKDFILLDHAGNADRHGLITEEQDVSLDGKYIGKTPRTCKTCFMVYSGSYCPDCGPNKEEQADRARKEILIAQGRLIELDGDPLPVQIRKYIDELKKISKSRGYKRGWIYYKVKDKFGEEIADEYFPKRQLPWFIQQKLAAEER